MYSNDVSNRTRNIKLLQTLFQRYHGFNVELMKQVVVCSACDEPAITKKNAKMCLNALIGVDGAAC